jgi:hypothetical protein
MGESVQDHPIEALALRRACQVIRLRAAWWLLPALIWAVVK